jgi:nucleoside-diphosphate-sugar epimerase
VQRAIDGCDVVWHLAYINGTRHFYERPADVLEVGIRGMLNVVDAAVDAGVRRLVLASTSETYNEPSVIPTPESEWLKIPDVTNPRFSYGGGKIACELLALHMAGPRGIEPIIFRPHNIYGSDMGFDHVVPELVERIVRLRASSRNTINLPIQGDGSETRAFCHVRDGAHGAFLAGELGKPGEIYNVGTPDEISIRQLIAVMGEILDVNINIVPGPRRPGGTSMRCPDISKLLDLGFMPRISLTEGLTEALQWYVEYYTAEVRTANRHTAGPQSLRHVAARDVAEVAS